MNNTRTPQPMLVRVSSSCDVLPDCGAAVGGYCHRLPAEVEECTRQPRSKGGCFSEG